jgi:uncharacterized low-complexity protein
MSEKKIVKPVALAVGAVLAGSFAISGAVNADTIESPFSISTLSAGYMLGEGEGSCGGDKGESKDAEGSCGEGSCGGDKDGDSHDKDGEGSCGGDKDGDSHDKDGEGSCGGDKDAEGSCGDDKDAEEEA